MKDTVFLKNDVKEDRLWEISPHIAFLPYLFLTILSVFGFIFVSGFTMTIESELVLNLYVMVGLFVPIGVMTYLVVRRNYYSNLSKSIAFVKRDNMLYVIQLGYLDTPSSAIINDPSGNIAQIAALKDNFEVAKGVQDAEKEVRERRVKEEIYTLALDEILKEIQKKPKKYYRKKERGETKFYGSLHVKGVIGFLILEEPRIERETKGYLWISYKDRHGERTKIKFRNAYGKMKEEIKIQNL